MESQSILFFIIILIILGIMMIGYHRIDSEDMVYVEVKEGLVGSSSPTSLVRNMPDKDESAKVLNEIKRRLEILIKYCKLNYPSNMNVMAMSERFNPNNIRETSVNESGSSYTLDKGKELRMCLRNKKTSQLHDINLLMFVAIHELAHIMSISYGHNQEFGKNFTFLLNQSAKLGIYVPIDYSKDPTIFCGVKVESNPMFASRLLSTSSIH